MLAMAGRIGVALAMVFGVAVAQAQSNDNRVALVIGNAAYQNVDPLRNPVNDARAMAALLSKLGFDVVERENASRRAMTEAMRAFAEKLTPGGVGLFFYAGHGMQVKGGNFLLPVDAALAAEDDLKYETVDVNDVLGRMDEARTRLSLVILDACRDNPFARGTRSTTRGLAAIDAPRGTVIAYATAPGKLPADGDGDNGLYTTELLKAMAEPGQTLEAVFKRTADGVERRSANAQTPWISSSFRGEFYFQGAPAAAAAAPAAAPATGGDAMELAAWNAVAASRNPKELEAFLSSFPSGRFAPIARAKLDELKGKASAAPVVAAASTPRAALAPRRGGASGGSAGAAIRDCPQCPELVQLPAGSFTMGASKEEEDGEALQDSLRNHSLPLHQVSLKAFAIGNYEVTFEEWDACVAAKGCSYRPADQGWGRERQPVIYVSSDDTREYLACLSQRTGKAYRLPSEAEWEYAARAGSTTRRP